MLNFILPFQAKFDRWIHSLTMAVIMGFVLLLLTSGTAVAEPIQDASDAISGAKIFEAQCLGCHVGGGNIVNWGKNLKLKTLQKNKLDTQEAVVNLVTLGKGNMSAYADRITPEEIQAVSAYVLSQAQADWK